VFAVQEGAIDAGVEIPHNDDVLAEWERTRGDHIADYAESLDDPLYSGDFDATDLPDHFTGRPGRHYWRQMNYE